MPYLTRDDVNIYYEYYPSEKIPDSEVIVLIHGLGLDMTTWKYVIPVFREHYHVLCFDLRGHGKSSDGEYHLNWNVLCEDLSALFTILNLAKVHIVAHGIGGNVGVEYVYRKPADILSITLLSTPWFYPKSVVNKVTSYRRSLTKDNTMRNIAIEMAQQICYPPTESKMELLITAYLNASLPIYFEFMEMFKLTLTISQLNEIETPILILAGEVDPLFAPNLFATSVNYFPNARFLIIPDSSNCVQLDQPSLFAVLVQNHMMRVKANEVVTNKSNTANKIYSEISADIRQMVLKGYEKSVETPELKIELLHNFRVEINGKEVTGNWERRYAKQLFLYLVLHSTVTREQLYEAFWGDFELTKAQNSLRVSLHYLKKLLEDSGEGNSERFLLIERERISLQGTIKCDLLEFMDKIKLALNEHDTNKKIMLCRGILEKTPIPFLAGFYDNWTLRIREKLEDQLVDLAKWMAKYYENNEEYREAHKYLKIALQFDEHVYDEMLLINSKMKKDKIKKR